MRIVDSRQQTVKRRMAHLALGDAESVDVGRCI
jgi:hypothetical protein